MPIIVYNRNKEDHSAHPYNFPIYRGASVLANPYTEKPLKQTKALFQVKTKEEALVRYDSYFDLQYQSNVQFTQIIDYIYHLFKNGETIFLECYCGPGTDGKINCHGEIIAEKLYKRLLKEKLIEYKKKRCKI